MADVDNGDILRIGTTWSLENVYEVTNVWHVLVEAGGGIDYPAASLDIQDYAEDLYAEIEVEMSNDMRSDFLTLSNVTQDTTFGAFAWQTALQGDSASAKTAAGVAGFAWARTLKPRVQIRKYFGVFTIAGIVNGEVDAALRIAMLAAMTTHITSYAGGPALTIKGVAYNRTLLTHTEAISATTAIEPAYQRRRKRGRGS